jgi:hypothetical protein
MTKRYFVHLGLLASSVGLLVAHACELRLSPRQKSICSPQKISNIHMIMAAAIRNAAPSSRCLGSGVFMGFF